MKKKLLHPQALEPIRHALRAKPTVWHITFWGDLVFFHLYQIISTI